MNIVILRWWQQNTIYPVSFIQSSCFNQSCSVSWFFSTNHSKVEFTSIARKVGESVTFHHSQCVHLGLLCCYVRQVSPSCCSSLEYIVFFLIQNIDLKSVYLYLSYVYLLCTIYGTCTRLYSLKLNLYSSHNLATLFPVTQLNCTTYLHLPHLFASCNRPYEIYLF